MTQASFALNARQHLSASPRLQQAVHLLQMSSMDFEQELRQAIASNPFLEDEDGNVDSDDAASSDDHTRSGDEPIASVDSVEGSPSLSTTVDGIVDSGYDVAFERCAPHVSDSDDDEPGDWACATPTLRDHLRSQICGVTLGPRERLALEVLIESLDDDGYLRSSPGDLTAVADITPSLTDLEVAAALRTLQRFDPAGVGARSLSECLALQIECGDASIPQRELALQIVRHYLDLTARRDYAALRRQLGCDDIAMREAISCIRHLDPHPGDRFSATHAGYVTPDVIVGKVKGRLVTTINPAVLPRTRLNSTYVEMLRRVRDDAHPTMSQQLQEARWLLRNVEQRFATIKRVADAIVERQRAFFSYGDVAIKPLVLREVAQELGLHESTVSRASGNKYMATPRGTFEFKHFFSRQLATGTGGTCSAAAVRALIKEILAEEDCHEPLSDVSLAEILTNQGICVARRTVAKYRNMMKVPPVELRRHG